MKGIVNIIVFILYRVLYQGILKFMWRKIFRSHEIERAYKSNNYSKFIKSICNSRVLSGKKFSKQGYIDSLKLLKAFIYIPSNTCLFKSNMITSKKENSIQNYLDNYYLSNVGNTTHLSNDIKTDPFYYLSSLFSYYLLNKKVLNSITERNLTLYYNKLLLIFIYLKVNLYNKTNIKYNSANVIHTEMLYEIWKETYIKMNVDKNNKEDMIELISQKWLDIGFQGKDPSTDLRSTGYFGLEQLVYFCKYSVYFEKVYLTATDQKKWYFFAAAGINITGKIVEYMLSYDVNDMLFNYFNEIIKNNSSKNMSKNKRLTDNKNLITDNNSIVDFFPFKNFEYTNKEKGTITLYEHAYYHLLNKFYENIFFEFNKLWLTQKNFSFMNFNFLFENFFNKRKREILGLSAKNAIIESK